MLRIKIGRGKTDLQNGDILKIYNIGQKRVSVERSGNKLSFAEWKTKHGESLLVKKSFDAESLVTGLKLAGIKCEISYNSIEETHIKIL